MKDIKDLVSVKKLGFPLIALIAGAIISAIAQGFVTERILASAGFTLGLLVACVFVLALMVHNLIDWTSAIDRRIGLNVRYLESKEGQVGLFEELRKIVEQAKDSIVIVNSFLPGGGLPRSNNGSESQERAFYDAIISRVAEADVRYQRVIQVEQESVLADMMKNDEYLRHFHKMLEQKERKPAHVGLLKAPASRPITFTMVDERWLLLAMNRRGSEGKTYMHGILIFEDPHGSIIKYFKQFYDSIVLSGLGAIQKTDLPPLGEDAGQDEATKSHKARA